MLNIKKEGILLEKTELEFENEGVLNPAAIKVGDSVYIYYRALRKNNYSCIGFARLDGPLNVAERWNVPILDVEFEYESHGVEDARITKIDDLYYMTYTVYDGINAQSALATSKDLKKFKKHGIIVPPITYSKFVFLAESIGVNENYYHNHKFYYQEADPDKKILLWDKNAVFFPRRINGKLVFLHRIRPGIQIVSVTSLDELSKEFWKEYLADFQNHIIMDPYHEHEAAYIGSGCPPIETEHGWVLIYHGVQDTEIGLIYSACAALLDLNDPSIELARLPYALFSPETEWEKNGEVNNVVFPTGTALFGDTLFIYYGAADSRIATASLSLTALTQELILNLKEHEK